MALPVANDDDTITRVDIKLNRSSPAFRRAKIAGFKIEDPTADVMDRTLFLRAPFTCICGKTETLCRSFSAYGLNSIYDLPIFKEGWDVAQDLEDHGSFSVDHLRKDGYTEEQIKEIRYIYDLEEELEDLRRQKYLFETGFYPYRTKEFWDKTSRKWSV